MTYNIKWINSEGFLHGKTHNIVLYRLHEKEQDNQWLTVNGDKYYIWRSDTEGRMWWEAVDTDFIVMYEVWKKIVRKLPKIELAHDGFHVLNGRSIRLGSEINIIPTMIDSDLTSDTWMVLLHYNGMWEPCRFPVYGKERVQWMHTYARLNQHLLIKLNKYQFERVYNANV